MEDKIKPGQLYKHYKGDTYKIIAVAKSSETEEWLVVYERQTNIAHTGWGIWVRPMDMFIENVSVGGVTIPRFEYISE